MALFLSAGKAQASTSLVIAEVYGGGGNTSAVYSNDFVVVFNPTTAAVDVNGWSIQYASSTGSSWQAVPLATSSKTIPPGGYYLVRLASGGAVGASVGTPDATGTINMSGTAGKVALCNSTTVLTGTCPTGGSVIDFVGFGTAANCSEAAPTPTLNNITSAQRQNGGCSDTDNNSADFSVGSPNPRNSLSAANLCAGGGGPLGIATQPQPVTTNVLRTAIFSVSASGTGPYTYQWKKIGVGNLTDGGNIAGATTSSLSISALSKADEGSYYVTVGNSVPESVDSVTVQLSVKEPILNTQPVSHTNVVGDIADVFATVYGTAPMSYQWFFNGNPVAIGTYTSSGLTNIFSANLTNIQPSAQGDYFLIASNSYGAVTTAVAKVSVFSTPATRIARWGFNNNSLLPSEGSGTVTLVGNTTATFAGGSFSDPSQIDAPLFNKGWGTSGYPPSGSSNKLAGIEFNSISTVGYKDLVLTWEQRHSNTASKYARLQYSSNGVDFVDHSVITMNSTNNDFVFFSSDLSGIQTLNNNPSVAFRIVSEFQLSATGSGVNDFVGTVGSYGTGGTIRYDLVSVYANSLSLVTPIPLNIQQVGPDVVLSWTDPAFRLQAAPEVAGVYTNVPGATSPYSTGISGGARFFRLINP